ncbi:type II toxin-antitoxin system YafO family toxin [Arenimonas daejeonensis]|uniref:type II toxin-antitoxin system YafO family toxin n=1 Tax=Arenimonas daejeonensis TaxID=370777 RepID=UPI0011BF90ED
MAVDVWQRFWNAVPDQTRKNGIVEIAELLQAWWLSSDDAKVASLSFGAYAPYSAPTVAGNRELWHVHLAPLRSDRVRWKRWAACRPTSRTSDAAVIFARRDDGSLLIIWVLNQDAHKIAKMELKESRDFMRDCAAAAREWRVATAVSDEWLRIVP